MQENSCNFSDVRPVILPLAYPPIQINKKNQACANMLSVDYCGAVSEMSAITQYINNEIYLSAEKCPVAKIILGIAMAEMIHLQKLGEMIYLLGGSVDFVSRQRDGRRWVWSPQCLTLPRQTREILMAGIESEKAAINQYEMHRKMITDTSVNVVLARIIKDEEYHIMLLQAMLKELS